MAKLPVKQQGSASAVKPLLRYLKPYRKELTAALVLAVINVAVGPFPVLCTPP